MDPKNLYGYALDQALMVGMQVDRNDLARPTPDADWNVEALMRHVLYELVWVPDILEGRTVRDVGNAHEGDLLGDDMGKSWREAVEAARQAMLQADLDDIAHLSYTDKPIREYLLESADDILVHSWDLGQAIGVDVSFDEGAAHTLYDYMSQLLKGGGGGLFASPITVSDSADWQTRLLALLGRSKAWS